MITTRVRGHYRRVRGKRVYVRPHTRDTHPIPRSCSSCLKGDDHLIHTANVEQALGNKIWANNDRLEYTTEEDVRTALQEENKVLSELRSRLRKERSDSIIRQRELRRIFARERAHQNQRGKDHYVPNLDTDQVLGYVQQ